jgi:hypothetical protein
MRFSEFKSTLESIDHDLIATAMLAKEKAAKQDKSSIPMQAFLNMLKNSETPYSYDSLVSAYETNPNLKNIIQQFNKDEIVFSNTKYTDNQSTSIVPVGDVPPEKKVNQMAKAALAKRESVDEDGSEQNSEEFLQKVAQAGDMRMLYDAQMGKYGPEIEKVVQEMYDDVTSDTGLHPDDDFEQIYDRMLDNIEADYGDSDSDPDGVMYQIRYLPYDSDKFMIVKGFTSEEEAEQYAKGENFDELADEWDIEVMDESVNETDEDYGSYGGDPYESIENPYDELVMETKRLLQLAGVKADAVIEQYNDQVDQVNEDHRGGISTSGYKVLKLVNDNPGKGKHFLYTRTAPAAAGRTKTLGTHGWEVPDRLVHLGYLTVTRDESKVDASMARGTPRGLARNLVRYQYYITDLGKQALADAGMLETDESEVTISTENGYKVYEVDRGLDISQEPEENPVASAILYRIVRQHPNVFMKYGPEEVMIAAGDVAEMVGDVDEIGSSDISIWTRQTIDMLDGMDESVTQRNNPISRLKRLAGLGEELVGEKAPPGFDEKLEKKAISSIQR